LTESACQSSSPPRMGFFYRKSLKFGPFRVNLSKSGIGVSVGGPGFRVGTSSRGRKYTSFSIPGTGVGYRKSGLGCLILIAGIPSGILLLRLFASMLPALPTFSL
jgi:hypothetical protein